VTSDLGIPDSLAHHRQTGKRATATGGGGGAALPPGRPALYPYSVTPDPNTPCSPRFLPWFTQLQANASDFRSSLCIVPR